LDSTSADSYPAHPQADNQATTSRRRRAISSGVAQLSLVEHAFCPLDDRLSLVRPLVHETGYLRADRHHHARWVPVRIVAHEGLSAADELFLWGLLALAFEQPSPSIEFYATPHWMLRQLGYLQESKGGSGYAAFRQVLRRLAGVTYYCEQFYDPIRHEERDRAFGLLKYDLPTSDDSSRAWRLVWDPLFAEYVQAKGGRMSFDLATYRRLDPAARRLFLLLSKVFWRRSTSPRFDVWQLCVHGLGFSPSVEMRNLKPKLLRVVGTLLEAGIVALPPEVKGSRDLFEKKGTGSYAIRLHRGAYFTDPSMHYRTPSTGLENSPLFDPLKAIGLELRTISWVLRTYRPNLIRVWADVTLAALEQQGASFFTSSPAAYFVDNLKHAASGHRTQPDWYRELKRRQQERERVSIVESFEPDREENRRSWEQARRHAFRDYVHTRVAREEYNARVQEFCEIFAATLPHQQALEEAIAEAERHFAAGFQFASFEEWTRKSA